MKTQEMPLTISRNDLKEFIRVRARQIAENPLWADSSEEILKSRLSDEGVGVHTALLHAAELIEANSEALISHAEDCEGCRGLVAYSLLEAEVLRVEAVLSIRVNGVSPDKFQEEITVFKLEELFGIRVEELLARFTILRQITSSWDDRNYAGIAKDSTKSPFQA